MTGPKAASTAFLACFLLLAAVLLAGTGTRAFAEEDWKPEFDAVCGKTDASMTLSKEELKDLVDRCDKLKARIETAEETTRKVYLRRLGMCRDLFVYVLESKEKE